MQLVPGSQRWTEAEAREAANTESAVWSQYSHVQPSHCACSCRSSQPQPPRPPSAPLGPPHQSMMATGLLYAE